MTTLRNAYYSQYDDDDAYLPPKRNPTPRRKQTFSRKLMGTLKKNPKRVVIGTLFFGIATMVSLNALMMQSSRHPAPIFAAAPPPTQQVAAVPALPLPPPAPPPEVRAAAVITPPEPVPSPVQAQAQAQAQAESGRRDAIADIIRTGSTGAAQAPAPAPRAANAALTPRVAAAAPAPAPRVAAAAKPAAKPQPPQRRDAIADLIRNNGSAATRPAAAPQPQAAASATDPQKRRISAAQQALVKLGYGPLPTDGVMGASTLKAIKRFEFDRRLPVTGTFNAQTVSELSSTSRVAIR